jgi:hypothetical protein
MRGKCRGPEDVPANGALGIYFRPEPSRECCIAGTYRIGGCAVVADEPIAELAAFSSAAMTQALPTVGSATASHGDPGRLVYFGRGLIADRWREVRCRQDWRGYNLSIEGVGSFSVDGEGLAIILLKKAPGVEAPGVAETVLGPPLILALALRGTWCLHGSAVVADNAAVALIGESGDGKSTLAAFLGLHGGPRWRLLADDILPVRLSDCGVEVLPHFPQLKLPPDAQPAAGMPERMPLRAIYVLEPPASEEEGVSVGPARANEAALALVRHSVAARLFDDSLLAKHLSFCADAAMRIPVRRLAYPRRHKVLPRVRDAIAEDLQSVSA